MQLPPRHYLLKVRGAGEPELTVTPDYSGPWELVAATHRATLSRRVPLVSPEVLDAELAWRWQWLEDTFTPRRQGGEGEQITLTDPPTPPTPLTGRASSEQQPEHDDLVSFGS